LKNNQNNDIGIIKQFNIIIYLLTTLKQSIILTNTVSNFSLNVLIIQSFAINFGD